MKTTRRLRRDDAPPTCSTRARKVALFMLLRCRILRARCVLFVREQSSAAGGRPEQRGRRVAKRRQGKETPVTVVSKLIAERKSALIIKVVDAADFEGSLFPRALLRTLIGSHPLMLAVNKVDRMPIISDRQLQNWKMRVENAGPKCVGVHAVSTLSGDGVDALAAQALEATAESEKDIILVGAKGSGKSMLSLALAQALEHRSGTTADCVKEGEGCVWPVDHSRRRAAPTRRVVQMRCFGDNSVASLFDTPGIPMAQTLPHCLPPTISSLLHGPSFTYEPIYTRWPLVARAGQSIVVQLDSQQARSPADLAGGAASDSGPLTLARVDVLRVGAPASKLAANDDGDSTDGGTTSGSETDSDAGVVSETVGTSPSVDVPVTVSVYLPSAVTAHVQPTASAPSAAGTRPALTLDNDENMPPGNIAGVKDLALKPPTRRHSGSSDAPSGQVIGQHWPFLRGHGVDITLPGLGHLAFYAKVRVPTYRLHAHSQAYCT